MAVGVRPVCRACLWPIGVVVAVLAARVCSLRPAHRLQRSSSSSSQHMASCAGLQRMGFACVRVHGVASAVQGGGGGGCSAALRRPSAPPQHHSTARSLHSFCMQARVDVRFSCTAQEDHVQQPSRVRRPGLTDEQAVAVLERSTVHLAKHLAGSSINDDIVDLLRFVLSPRPSVYEASIGRFRSRRAGARARVQVA